jgi:nucleosome binding factor SPN SPT16 subunit
LIIADTVRIGSKGAIAITEGTFKLSDVVTNLEEEEEESEEEVKPKKKEKEREKEKKPTSSKANGKDSSKARPSGPVGGARMTRGQRQSGPAEQTSTEKIKPNQDRLHAQRQAQGLKRFEKGGKGKNGQEEKQVKKYESYRREEQLPKQVEDRRVSISSLASAVGRLATPTICADGKVYVDEQRSTIVLPVYGYAVPFHISTIKNVTKTEEAEYVVLRINFQSPGQIAGKKEDMVSHSYELD